MLSHIEHMRCAVHSLQLSIRDGLKEQHIANLLSKFRQLAIFARTPKIDSIIKKHSGNSAILDQDTRRGITYLMIRPGVSNLFGQRPHAIYE